MPKVFVPPYKNAPMNISEAMLTMELWTAHRAISSDQLVAAAKAIIEFFGPIVDLPVDQEVEK